MLIDILSIIDQCDFFPGFQAVENRVSGVFGSLIGYEPEGE
jgi:hypothetical protein